MYRRILFSVIVALSLGLCLEAAQLSMIGAGPGALAVAGGGGTVAFDAGSEGTAAGTSLTFAHTVSGANRVLYVACSHTPGDTDVDGLSTTFDSVSMAVFYTDITTHGSVHTRIFRLVAPNTGTHDIVVSWTGGSTIYCIGASFTVVDQSDPDDDPGTPTDGGEGGTSSAQTVTSATGDMAVDVMVAGSGVTVLAQNASQTLIHQFDNTGNPNSMGMSYWAGAASRNMQWTWTGFVAYVQWGFNINAAP
jgi:hypothetical protein